MLNFIWKKGFVLLSLAYCEVHPDLPCHSQGNKYNLKNEMETVHELKTCASRDLKDTKYAKLDNG